MLALPPCHGPDGRAMREDLAAYRPLIWHHASLTLIVAACVEHAGVWAMWIYYGAFYV